MRLLFLSIFTAIIASGCASINSKIYSKNEILQITSWEIDFAYESSSIEATKKAAGNDELKLVRSSQLATDLELRDDLYFMLKYEYLIPVTKTQTHDSGKIFLHPIHFSRGGFGSLTVNIVNSKGDTLGRLKIKNGDRKATYKDEEEFTKYAADAIVQAITNKKK
ncbi:hypothetical protein [Bathymodiolus thermophilus thioautotrophic gill symbiont]|uniref:Lipoprotein n=1 Tax=Bathymodiolus thermophilus thioautotrophic gill symbiont TaxID=2360 RepID=A0A1J5TS94_9GAMM|nr:hypothetical protein [Bathymodiolus thermophilus thioautotrophic gill symbiont]OIR23787.1 hypothetical protein BGC33_08105 [Bathymodiolus thermophilus thioautotrophic gill symbiont]